MNMDFNDTWKEIERRVHGWLWKEKAEAMWNLVLQEKAEKIVEIGCWAGRSLIVQALAMKALGGKRIIYGIDPYDNEAAMIDGGGDPEACEWCRTHDYGEVFGQLLHNILEFKVHSQVRLINIPSREAVLLELPVGADIFHIDGNHSAESSMMDAEFAVMVTRPRGHIWLDDSHWKSQDGTVKFLSSECERVAEIGTSILFRRR